MTWDIMNRPLDDEGRSEFDRIFEHCEDQFIQGQKDEENDDEAD